MAGCPWQANGRGSGSSVVEIVASISSPQRCGPDATRQRPSPGRCCYLWLRRTALPLNELRWRRDAMRAVLLPIPAEQTCILHQSLCLGPYRSRDVFTPVEPLGKCIYRNLEKRVSISCVQVATSSSMTRAYFRSVASAMVCPAMGSWQKAIVAVRKACSRCLCRLDRSFCACRCRRVRSEVTRAN